jgi:hypothetical protein
MIKRVRCQHYIVSARHLPLHVGYFTPVKCCTHSFNFDDPPLPFLPLAPDEWPMSSRVFPCTAPIASACSARNRVLDFPRSPALCPAESSSLPADSRPPFVVSCFPLFSRGAGASPRARAAASLRLFASRFFRFLFARMRFASPLSLSPAPSSSVRFRFAWYTSSGACARASPRVGGGALAGCEGTRALWRRGEAAPATARRSRPSEAPPPSSPKEPATDEMSWLR